MNLNSSKILLTFSLKWNPFTTDVPNEGLVSNADIEKFCWRVESLVMDGGYALITGDSGLGKSSALRIISNRLSQLREVKVGIISRPQSGLIDFYRELGHLFEIDFKISNRWGGYRHLRERWINHINSTLLRPILFIDEAQEMPSEVLNEIRFLSSTNFDSKIILTVILCGDSRLPEKFKQPALVPLGSRVRVRLQMPLASKEELIRILEEKTSKAGNGNLMTKELMEALANHSSGNYRILMNMSEEMLAIGAAREVKQLNESLFFDIYNFGAKTKTKK